MTVRDIINRGKRKRELAECSYSDSVESTIVSDNVNHPAHYESGQYECTDVMLETQGIEAVKDFCICNAFKYLYRHRKKNGVEDIRKAHWYISKFIELEDMEKRKQ